MFPRSTYVICVLLLNDSLNELETMIINETVKDSVVNR